MTNTLIPTGTVPETDTSRVMSVSKNKDYLPRLKLCGAQAGECQRGIVGIGHYALIKSRQDIEDVGNDLNVIIIAGRAKAVQLGDPIIQSFDPECTLFKDIQEESTRKDSEAMYGPEFLVYIPDLKVYATFFMCNPTGRIVAPDLSVRMGNGANLTSILIENKKFKWHGPVIKDCGEPLDVPDSEKMSEVATKFLNEKDSEVELAEEGRDR